MDKDKFQGRKYLYCVRFDQTAIRRDDRTKVNTVQLVGYVAANDKAEAKHKMKAKTFARSDGHKYDLSIKIHDIYISDTNTQYKE